MFNFVKNNTYNLNMIFFYGIYIFLCIQEYTALIVVYQNNLSYFIPGLILVALGIALVIPCIWTRYKNRHLHD